MSRRESYEAYIKSPAWKRKREEAFRKYGKRCAGCGSIDLLHVHHKSYARFTRERLTDLVIVCEGCHSVIHDFHEHRNPKKLDLWRVTELVIAQLRAENGRNYAPTGWVPASQREDYTDPLASRREKRKVPSDLGFQANARQRYPKRERSGLTQRRKMRDERADTDSIQDYDSEPPMALT